MRISFLLLFSFGLKISLFGQNNQAAYYMYGGNSVFEYFCKNFHTKDNVCDFEGSLKIIFKIDYKGHVKKVQIFGNICLEMKQDIVRTFLKMGKWVPARDNMGKPIGSVVTVPFIIENPDE